MRAIFCSAVLILYLPFLFAEPSESSYPYISGYTWWHFCDWKLTNPDYGKSTSERFDPEKVQPGDTIFVEYDCLEEFARYYLPRLKNKAILITANYGYHADMPLPGPYGFILGDEKVAAWFVQNIDRAPSEKLIPMPIGLASNYWPHGNNMLVDSMIPYALKNQGENQKRPLFIYLNFSMTPERRPCANHFTLMGVELQPRKSYATYLRDLTKAVFVISPPGGGIDCHRTWEALLFGCFPVLKSTTLDPLFEDLPVVIVQDWEEATQEFLQERYDELKNKTWSRDKLYSAYWFQRVRDLQEGLRNETAVLDANVAKIIQHSLSSSWKEAYYDVLPALINEHGYQTVLEVGVALGGHAEAILNNTKITSYIGIDPYKCYDANDGFQQDVANYSSLDTQRNFDSLYQWVSNFRLKPYAERCKLIRKTSLEAASEVADESLDCIFIDGDHNYEAVKKDLAAWFPKLKKGHLMIGDDYWMDPVSKAVDEFFALSDRQVSFFTSATGYKLWAVYK